MKASVARFRTTISRPEDREIIRDHLDGPVQSQAPHKAEGKEGEEEGSGGVEGRGEGPEAMGRIQPH